MKPAVPALGAAAGGWFGFPVAVGIVADVVCGLLVSMTMLSLLHSLISASARTL
jgi:hypothetical protein